MQDFSPGVQIGLVLLIERGGELEEFVCVCVCVCVVTGLPVLNAGVACITIQY